MSNRDLEFIEEESSSIQKPTDDSQAEGKTNYDYAKILAEMKKELENIPTKYPNAENNNDISSQKYSEPSESLELNMVKTGDVRNKKEETNNVAYSDSDKKDISEDNEPYDEDFEHSEDKAQSSNQQATERNESAQSYSRESPNPAKTNLQATVKREKSSPMKKNTSQEDDYENDDFEEEVVDDDISEIKREKSISSHRSTPPPVIAVTKKDDKDKKVAPPAKTTTNQNNSKAPQPAQSNSAKNFKIKPGVTPANKEVKKEPTARPSSSKEPIQKPVQPPKDTKPVTKPPLKRPATAKAALTKTVAVLNMKNKDAKKEPALAKTTTEKVDKVDEDFEFVEEEEMVADQNANPTAITKKQERPQTVGAKSREQVSNNDDNEEIIEEEDVQDAGTKAKNKFKPVKKVEHKDIMKQIFDSFKKKEEVNQKKDENIYATEEADKRVKTAGAGGKNKSEDQENKWVGNGLGLSTNVIDATKKGKTTGSTANTKPESGSTQSFAQKFLTSLENKFKKVPKLGQTTGAGAPQDEEETKDPEDKKKRAQSAKKAVGSKNDLEKTWKYNVGSGVNSEYEKTQKAKEKESQKRFTELFKKEKGKAKNQKQENLTKIKEIMNKERENRKAIEEKFVKNMRTGNKGSDKESRDPLVLQVQNVYLEEEERNKREKQKEEITQLKLKLKLLKSQNQGLQKDLVELQHRDSNAGRQLDSLASKKAVIMIGKNEFTSLNSHLIPKDRSKASTTARSETDRSNILEDDGLVINLDKLSPIEIIINKFADQELELEEIYQLLDKNGDGILTLKEIKEGLEKLHLDLDEGEIQQIITVVDANTDGTITCEEFVSSLKESLAVRKDYKSIMGDLDKITNPIVLEERILDMETRKKLIEEDTKKVTDELKVHEYGYKKLVRRLQEFEGMGGAKKETKTDLDHIRNIIIRLKVEISDAEDMKSRVELMQDERMKDITENIQTLEEKIERTIRKIQEEKRKAKDLAQEQQKEELRKIFMMKAFGEIEREMETFDTGLDKNVQNMIEEKQRLQAKREEEENMNALDGHIMNGAAIKIQKVYRGAVHRKKAQNVSITLLKAKMLILKRWKSYKKRTKTVGLASKIKGLLRKVLGDAFENIRGYSEEKAEQQQEQARTQQEKNKSASPAGGKKTLGRTATGERDDDEVSQLSGVGENGVPLYTVLYLQDLARKKLGKETPEDNKLLYRKTDKKAEKCGVCRKEPVERVCKECEIALFCTKCFATTHKSRKNHMFIEVKAKQSDEKTTISVIESKDPEMAAELNYLQEKYQKEFKNLVAHMRDWDVENAGYFDIRGFRETLKRKVKDENELDFLVKVAKTYCQTKKTNSQDLQIDYVSFAKLVCS